MFRPDSLGVRGAALWDSMEAGASDAALVLLGEACRLADRLDKLDAILRGDVDTWMYLAHRTRTEDYELKIDAAASEARQSANVLRQILLQVSKQSTGVAGEEGEGDDPFTGLAVVR